MSYLFPSLSSTDRHLAQGDKMALDPEMRKWVVQVFE